MDTSEVTASKRRYRTNAEKVRIVEETLVDNVSIAAVARRHGVNAHLLFTWRRLYQQGLLERSREPVAAKLLPVHGGQPATWRPQMAPACPRYGGQLYTGANNFRRWKMLPADGLDVRHQP